MKILTRKKNGKNAIKRDFMSMDCVKILFVHILIDSFRVIWRNRRRRRRCWRLNFLSLNAKISNVSLMWHVNMPECSFSLSFSSFHYKVSKQVERCVLYQTNKFFSSFLFHTLRGFETLFLSSSLSTMIH